MTGGVGAGSADYVWTRLRAEYKYWMTQRLGESKETGSGREAEGTGTRL